VHSVRSRRHTECPFFLQWQRESVIGEFKRPFVEGILTVGKHKFDFIAVCRKFNEALLVTRGVDEALHGRPLLVARLEASGDLWFVTDRNLGKLPELKQPSEVCVTMSGCGELASVSGKAIETYDRAKIREYWKETWRVWFPDGESDLSLMLVHVSADFGEFWSGPEAIRIKHYFAVRDVGVPNASHPVTSVRDTSLSRY